MHFLLMVLVLIYIVINDSVTFVVSLTIDNVGGKDVVIDKIQVRGVEASWSNVAYLRLSSPVSSSLIAPNSSYSSSLPGNNFVYVSGTKGDFSTASSDFFLDQ